MTTQAVTTTNPHQQMLDPIALAEKAMARREARLAKSTAKEVKELDLMQRTGVMSPAEADALKLLAVTAYQIDTNKLPKIPGKYETYKPVQPPKMQYSA